MCIRDSVTAVNVKAGDVVAAGQVLLEIDTKQVDTSKNSMDAAKVAWDDAQSTPVSYTHLDVYKRQSPYSSIQPESPIQRCVRPCCTQWTGTSFWSSS